MKDRRLAVLCGISFACFLGSYMRVPIVPLYAASLGADAAQAGAVSGAFMLAAGLLSVPLGLLSDRWGRRPLLLGGLALLSASSFLLFAARTPLQLALVYLLFGAAIAAVTPTLMSCAADAAPSGSVGRAIGIYTMALYGGMTLGPAAGGFLGGALGLRAVFLAAGAVILAVFLAALSFGVGRSPEGGAGGARRETSPIALRPLLRTMAGNRRLAACLAGTLGGCVAFGAFVTFVPLYARSLGISTAGVGVLFAAQALANGLSRIPAGRLCDRSAERGGLVAAALGSTAAVMAVLGNLRSGGALAAAAAAAGLSLGISFTLLSTLTVESVTGESRGLAMGLYSTAVYAGMVAASVGMGAVVRRYGFGAGFAATGATVAASLIPFLLLYREPEGRGETAPEGGEGDFA